MSASELQTEEREALSSIYDGDNAFKQISSTIFQYKYGENDTAKSFLLELQWGENYPDELPTINMDTFYNRHILTSIKEKVIKYVESEAEQYLGMSMTYSLFEIIKEKFDDVIAEQPDTLESYTEKSLVLENDEPAAEARAKFPKKEQLTKAQKRRQWNKLDNKGEKPRGWDWVDIIKHLSQTGPTEPTDNS